MIRGRTKKTEPTTEKEVYLYKLNSDGIVEMHGKLFKYGYSRMMFRCNKLTSEVSLEPGKIYRRFVWFDKPNFEKAKSLFIEYEQNLIEQSRQKIDSCEKMINIIKSFELK